MRGPIFGLFAVPLICKYDAAIPLEIFTQEKLKHVLTTYSWQTYL